MLPPNFFEINNFKSLGIFFFKVEISKQPKEQVSTLNVFKFLTQCSTSLKSLLKFTLSLAYLTVLIFKSESIRMKIKTCGLPYLSVNSPFCLKRLNLKQLQELGLLGNQNDLYQLCFQEN